MVTGFLGAGKTTLINRLLADHQDIYFALVENEFGDVAIDSKLVKGIDASMMFELKNGCICCTIAGEYELVLKELAGRFPEVQHLLIETTGIADPLPVITPFFRNAELRNLYHFNGTICLVDAKRYDLPETKNIIGRQIAVADKILVSKTENVVHINREQIVKWIKQFNSLSAVIFSDHGVVPEFVLNMPTMDERFFHIPEKQDHQIFVAKTITLDFPCGKLNFTEWLSYVLDLHKNVIFRIKGILVFLNEPYVFILHGAGGSFELVEGEELALLQKSTMVVISSDKNIDLPVELLQS